MGWLPAIAFNLYNVESKIKMIYFASYLLCSLFSKLFWCSCPVMYDVSSGHAHTFRYLRSPSTHKQWYSSTQSRCRVLPETENMEPNTQILSSFLQDMEAHLANARPLVSPPQASELLFHIDLPCIFCLTRAGAACSMSGAALMLEVTRRVPLKHTSTENLDPSECTDHFVSRCGWMCSYMCNSTEGNMTNDTWQGRMKTLNASLSAVM